MSNYRIITNGYRFVVQKLERKFYDPRLKWRTCDYMQYPGDIVHASFTSLKEAEDFKKGMEQYDLEQAADSWEVVG